MLREIRDNLEGRIRLTGSDAGGGRRTRPSIRQKDRLSDSPINLHALLKGAPETDRRLVPEQIVSD
jgi:hypothetical protein